MAYQGFTDLQGYVDRLKEEADKREEEERRKKEEDERRRQEEERLAQWRRTTPIGPPTRDITKGTPSFAVAKAPPKQQVGLTGPAVDTGAPQLNASNPMMATVAPPQSPTMEPAQKKRTEVRYDPLSSANTGLPPKAPPAYDPLAGLNSWQRKPPVGTIQSPIPGMIGNAIQQGVQAAGNLDLSQYIPQPLKEWAQEAFKPISEEDKQRERDKARSGDPYYLPPLLELGKRADWLGQISTPKSLPLLGGIRGSNPVYQHDADLKDAAIAQRHAEEKWSSAFPDTGYTETLGEGSAGPITIHYPDVTKQVLGVVEQGTRWLGDLTDLMGLTQLGSLKPLGKDGTTLAQDVAFGFDILNNASKEGGRREGFEGPFYLDANTYFSMMSNPMKLGAYIDAANTHLIDATTPNAWQLRFTTEQDRYNAKNKATYNAWQGVQAVAGTYDDTLNNPVYAAQYYDDSVEMAHAADAQTDVRVRTQMYAKAAQLQAKGIALRETTDLAIFSKNSNMWIGLPASIMLDAGNVWGEASKFLKLTPQARRYTQAAKAAVENADLVAGFDRTLLTKVTEPVLDIMKQQGSQAQTSAFTGFGVIANAVSGVTTKGDYKAIINGVLENSIVNGIATNLLSSDAAALLDDGTGLAHFGHAGILDSRFQDALPDIQAAREWIDSLPSLMGDAGEAVNDYFFQSDLIGALTRSAAQSHDVSPLKGVPFGASKFVVIPSPTNAAQATVHYLDRAKAVVGQSAVLNIREATDLANQMTETLRKGEEYSKNILEQIAAVHRAFASAFNVNTPRNTFGNAIGGNVLAMIDGTWSMEHLDRQVDYVLTKMGGLFPSPRMAEEIGNIKPVSDASAGAMSTGSYTGFWGNLLNIASLGIAKPMQKIRSGTGEIAGIKYGEKSMATSVYTTAFKKLFEDEWRAKLPPIISQMLGGQVTDPQVLGWMSDQLLQAGLAGGRMDIAKAINDITSGRVSLSLHTIAPTVGSVLKGQNTLEINDILRNLNMENIAAGSARVHEIFEEERTAMMAAGAALPDFVGRRFNIGMDNAKDVADISHTYKNIAQMAGINPDVAHANAQFVKDQLGIVTESLMNLAQMTTDKPNMMYYTMDAYNIIEAFKDAAREQVGALGEQAHNAVELLKDAARAASGDMPAVPMSNFAYPAEMRARQALQPIEQGVADMARQYSDLRNLVPPDMLDRMSRSFGLTKDQTSLMGSILSARAETWAKQVGKDASEYFPQITAFFRTNQTRPAGMADDAFAWFSPTSKPDVMGRIAATVAMFQKQFGMNETDRLGILAHEVGHMFTMDMEMVAHQNPQVAQQWEEAKKWAGFLNPNEKHLYNPQEFADWQNQSHEKFADAFVDYLRRGVAPKGAPSGMVAVFEQFKSWLNTMQAWLRNHAIGASSLGNDAKAQSKTFDFLLNSKLSKAGQEVPPPSSYESVFGGTKNLMQQIPGGLGDELEELAMAAPKKLPNPTPVLPQQIGPALDMDERINLTDARGTGNLVGKITGILTPDLTGQRGYGYEVESYLKDAPTWKKTIYDADLARQDDVVIQRFDKRGAQKTARRPLLGENPNKGTVNDPRIIDIDRTISNLESGSVPGFEGGSPEQIERVEKLKVQRAKLLTQPPATAPEMVAAGEALAGPTVTDAAGDVSLAPTQVPAGAAPTSTRPIFASEPKRPSTKNGKNYAYFGQSRVAQEIDPVTQLPKPIEVNPDWVNSVQWKIHLNTTNEDDAVMRLNDLGFLHQDHPDASLYSPKIMYKFANEGGGADKGITIYVGSRDRVNKVAAQLSQEFKDIIKPAVGEMLKDDIELAPGIYGRFDAGTTDGLFHRYGSAGHPNLYTDQEAILADRNALTSQQMSARADKMLRERYGEYYTGTGVTQQVAPGLAQGVATPPVAAAATQPLEEAIWRAGDTDFPIKITGVLGEHNGEKYYSIEGSSTGVPESQIIRTPQAAAPPAARTMEDVINEAVPPTTPAKAPRKTRTPAAGAPPPPNVPPPSIPTSAAPPVPPAAAAESAAPTGGSIWADTFKKQHQVWVDFGKKAQEIIKQAMDGLPSAQQRILDGQIPRLEGMLGPNGESIDSVATEFLANLSVDRDAIDTWLKTKVGFASKDPAWELKRDALRQGVDAMQRRMMLMFFHHPTEASMNEYLQAFEDVKHAKNEALRVLRPIQSAIANAEAMNDTVEKTRLYDLLKEQNNVRWGEYFQTAIERFWSGAVRIGEVNLPPELMDNLKFRPQGAQGDWTLLGPDFLQRNQWRVLDHTGTPSSLAVGPGSIPNALIDRYNEIRRAAEMEVVNMVANLGMTAGREAGGNPAVNELLARLHLDPHAQEMLNTVRAKVAETLANYSPQTLTTAEIPPHSIVQLDAAEAALRAAMTNVAQMNAAGFGRMGLEAAGNLRKRVLPLFDNILTAAQKYGQKMTDFTMVGFTNKYHPDALLGLYAPFHYWWTRQGKNAIERMLFNPRVSLLMGDVFRASEAHNRAEDQPNRNIETFPGGFDWGDVTYKLGLDILPRWIPWAPQMILNGWANGDRASRSYEYLTEMNKQNSWPATLKTVANAAIFAHEVGKQMGLNPYPGFDDLAAWAVGDKMSFQGRLGDINPLYRILGYGATAFAKWMKSEGRPLNPTMEQAIDYLGYNTLPDYNDYLTGREATNEVVRGNLTENEGYFVKDVVNQGITGRAPMPEQALLAPKAEQQTAHTEASVALEYFVKNLLSWVSGAPITSISEPEMKMRAAKKEQQASMYKPGTQEAGSQSAYYGITDPGSPNYQRGLGNYNQQYATTMETAPGIPDAKADRPALGAVTNEYFDRRKVITDRYVAETEAAYDAHPEWGSPDGEPPTKVATAQAKAFRADRDARKNAELDALNKQFPTVAGQYGQKHLKSEKGARPAEVVDDAQTGAYQRAIDNLESIYPGDLPDATQADWENYEKAVLAETQRLTQNPNELASILFGSEESINRDIARHGLQAGKKPAVPANAAPATAVPSGLPATAAPAQTGGGFTPDPKNPYVDKMVEQEQKYGLPPGMLQSFARHESGFDPNADSGAAKGLMQFVPGTWKMVADALGLTDINDPEQSIEAAAYYLDLINKQLPAEHRNDPAWIAAAYNTGPAAVAKMTSLDDILTTKNPYTGQPYPDAKARLAYAKAIAAEIGAAQPIATAPTAAPTVAQRTYTNPNWGKVEGSYTVVGDPITDSGITWVSPVPEGTTVTQTYGEKSGALGDYYGRVNHGFGHEGIDYSLPEGTHINSVADGTVIFAGVGNGRPAYGNMIVVDHGNGYISRYGHLSGFAVEVGDTVTAGQYIGDVGHTPISANIGNHLHLAIEREGETSGPWNTVDPYRLIGQGDPMLQATSASPVAPTTPSVAAVAPAIGATPEKPARTKITPSTTTPTTAGGFPFTKTAEQIVAEGKARGRAPSQVRAEAQVDAAFQAIEDRANATYPEWATLYQEYKGVHDADKKQWTADNPMIRALNMAGYNPAEWQTLEKTFGKGIVEKWAQIPPYNGVDSDDRSTYYHQYPKVFVANAWIKGRPEVYDENAYDPLKQFEYNFGKDYEEAKKRYGDDIWNTVEQYYKNPAYVKGGDNTVWLKFKQDHPEYDEWHNWWYEKLGLVNKPFVPYQAGNFGAFSFPDFGGSSDRMPQVQGVDFMRQQTPRWEGGSGAGSGDWRKYFNIPEPNLRGWRR